MTEWKRKIPSILIVPRDNEVHCLDWSYTADEYEQEGVV